MVFLLQKHFQNYNVMLLRKATLTEEQWTYSSRTWVGRSACQADISAVSWDMTTSPKFCTAHDQSTHKTNKKEKTKQNKSVKVNII